jgi:hypothetical protein
MCLQNTTPASRRASHSPLNRTMRDRPYSEKLITRLRETLSQLEQWAGSADDPTLRELKASILRTIAEHELRNEERAIAKTQKGTTSAVEPVRDFTAGLWPSMHDLLGRKLLTASRSATVSRTPIAATSLLATSAGIATRSGIRGDCEPYRQGTWGQSRRG